MSNQYSLISVSSEERFWSKVVLGSEDDCWTWRGRPTPDGYGKFYINNLSYLAHRYSWSLVNGIIPTGMEICHSCDNPPCVNPRHLWLGTHQDNIRDRDTKGRQYDRRGSRNGRAVLDMGGAMEVRRLRSLGWQYKAIAKHMNVSEGCVNHIINNRHWKEE